MKGSRSRLVQPWLVPAALFGLGALLLTAGLRTQNVDFDALQRTVQEGETRVEAVVVAHREGFPTGKVTQVEWQEIGATRGRAFVPGWIGTPGETIELIVWIAEVHLDGSRHYEGRVPLPPGEVARPPVDLPAVAVLIGSGLIALAVAVLFGELTERRDRADGSDS